MTDTYTLPRTGDVPLSVAGVVVASASIQQAPTKRELPLERRFHVLTLYRSAQGQHVGHISYRTLWPGELDDHVARVGTLADVMEWFRQYEPTGPVIGFPRGRGFAERQANLLDSIELGYDAALSVLLAGTGVTETIA